VNPAARPSFYVIVGAPGAGKSSQLLVVLAARAPRRMIFDIEHEYGAAGAVATLEGIRKGLVAAGGGPFSYVFQPSGDDLVVLRQQFDVFCRLAFAAGNLELIVDELADVDSPNRYEVPPGWALVLRRGRKRELRIVGATQRPADVNNRLWSFATRFRVGMLGDSDDVRELARVVMVDPAEVAALLPLDWIERDRMTAATTRGRIEWRAGRPVNLPRARAAAPAPQKKVTARRPVH
jgi:hypothetical protein